MTVQAVSGKRTSNRARASVAILATVFLTFGGSVVDAKPAAAANCSSLFKDGSYIGGTCYGYSFTIWWECWWSPIVNKRTFTPGWTNGLSFRFYACDSGVYRYGLSHAA